MEAIGNDVRSLEEVVTKLDLEVDGWTVEAVRGCEESIASIEAALEEHTELNDSLETGSFEEITLKKDAESFIFTYSNRVAELSDEIDCRRITQAENKKISGNDEFKKGNFAAALEMYKNAIDYDPSNAVYYTNRALVLQKMDDWIGALSDAEYAVSLDAGMLKGHIILIKCQIKLNLLEEVAESLEDVPQSLQKRPEYLEQKTLAAAASKNVGNDFLKDGQTDTAINSYTLAIRMDDANHLFYSNRCAAYQTSKLWDKAITDAEKVLELSPLFPKGHLHLARCLLQCQRFEEANIAVAKAKSVFENKGELKVVHDQLSDIARQIVSAVNRAVESSPPMQAEALKGSGNASYKAGDYTAAVRFYTQAISMMPEEGSYYGNRAACWIMMKEYQRAADDCAAGLKLEKTSGELDKLRLRQATALVHLGNMDAALSLLGEVVTKVSAAEQLLNQTNSVTAEEAEKEDDDEDEEDEWQEIDSDDEEWDNEYMYNNRKSRKKKQPRLSSSTATPLPVTVNARLNPFIEQMKSINTVKTNIAAAAESLAKREFSRVKRLLLTAQSGGATADPYLHLLQAKACLGLGEMEECSREAQLVVVGCKGVLGKNALLFDAYMVRGEALQGLGSTDQATKYFSAALQLDPDNAEAARKYKALRKAVNETTRIRGEIDKAIGARTYELALTLCGEGLLIDKDSKKLLVEMHLKRAKVHKLMAKNQTAKAQAAPSSSSGKAPPADAAPQAFAEELIALAAACWKRCLQDCTSAMYFDSITLDGITACLLKLESLQGLNRFEEAVSECETYIATVKGKGLDIEELKANFTNAKLLLKKSKRVNLYSILGVAKEHLATEQEIKTAYKKAALKWHPDRHSGSNEEMKKEAENRFKEIGDIYEILIDPTKKRLWDQGCDREELDQRAEHAKQGGHGGGFRGHGGGFGGFY